MKIAAKKWIKFIASAVIVVTTLSLIQAILMPKYSVDGPLEGAFVAEYYDEVKDHDVIFVGDCEVYENFSPIVLWRDYGINSYIRGSADQYIYQSYYLLEDTLRYETPDVVIFNVQALDPKREAEAKEAYNRMTIDGMKWSPSKVGAINSSMLEDEHFLDYVFPILRYHSRWSDLNRSDFTHMFKSEKVSHNGYLMKVGVKPADNVPEGKPLPSYEFTEKAWEHLDKMVELCEEKGIKLLLIKAPSLYPYWYPEYDEQVVDYAKKHGLTYINFLDIQDETGIDYTKDTYDMGLHMNVEGAEKLSTWLGKYLTENMGLTDRRDEEALSEIWLDKIAFYEADKKAKYEEYEKKLEAN